MSGVGIPRWILKTLNFQVIPTKRAQFREIYLSGRWHFKNDIRKREEVSSENQLTQPLLLHLRKGYSPTIYFRMMALMWKWKTFEPAFGEPLTSLFKTLYFLPARPTVRCKNFPVNLFLRICERYMLVPREKNASNAIHVLSSFCFSRVSFHFSC